jgi:UDP-glucose 4-epimerase
LKAAACEEANGQIFNLGGERAYSLTELAQMCVKVYGKGEFATRTFPADRKRIDIGDYFADYTKISTVLEWKPVYNLEDGLKKTFAFYSQHLKHYV